MKMNSKLLKLAVKVISQYQFCINCSQYYIIVVCLSLSGEKSLVLTFLMDYTTPKSTAFNVY